MLFLLSATSNECIIIISITTWNFVNSIWNPANSGAAEMCKVVYATGAESRLQVNFIHIVHGISTLHFLLFLPRSDLVNKELLDACESVCLFVSFSSSGTIYPKTFGINSRCNFRSHKCGYEFQLNAAPGEQRTIK